MFDKNDDYCRLCSTKWTFCGAYSIQGEAREREIYNLVKLSQQFSEVHRLVILTKNEQEHIIQNGVVIEVMPVWRFFLDKLF